MLLAPCLALALSFPADPEAPPAPPREFRAVWVATVDNIDWPSKRGLPTAEAQAELSAIFDKAAALHLNAVILQVRPMGDALYSSKLEPWSEFLTGKQGKAPDPAWDPLETAVAEAHRRGLELHAWFNPFRAWHPAAKSESDKSHLTRSHPEWIKHYGNFQWLDPGQPAARAWSLRVMEDVVRRYDVDGIHIDDYFYPYPVKGQDFPDRDSYARHGHGLRSEWRRANVDAFVHDMYAMVKRVKPWVKVGISPFGIYRPGVPSGIQANLDQVEGLYADPKRWLAEGWCDYLSPQLYWKIGQPHQAYPVLLRWWLAQNPKGRHLWPGNFASQISTPADWPVSEIIDQIDMTRRHPGAGGNVLFSMKPLMADAKGIDAALLAGPYKQTALVPPSPWLGDKPPVQPTLVTVTTPDELRVRIDMKPANLKPVRLWAIWTRYAQEWSLEALPVDEKGLARPMASGGKPLNEVAVAAVDRNGALSAYALWKPDVRTSE